MAREVPVCRAAKRLLVEQPGVGDECRRHASALPGTFHVVVRDGAAPSWSPDGQWIVFTYGGYVKEVRADGQGVRHILYVTSNKGVNFEPNWGH
jgi:hypothetical protein